MQASIETELSALREQVRQLARELQEFRNAARSPFFTRDEAAAWLRVSTSTLDDLIGRGQLPRRRLGRHVLICKEDLERCLTS